MSLNLLAQKTNIIPIFLILFFLYLTKCIGITSHKNDCPPRIINLSNNDLFMVTSNSIQIKSDLSLFQKYYHLSGASINKSKFKDEINTVAQFPESDGGNIIALVQDVFYFFDKKGEKIFQQDLNSEIHDDLEKKIYSIIPDKKDSNKFYFILSYMNFLKQLVLKYYEIDTSTSTPSISCKTTKVEKINYMLEKRDIINYGPSCTKMKMENSEETDVITCFFTLSYNVNYYVLTTAFYEIQNNGISFFFVKKGEYFLKNMNTQVIKSVASPDLHSALVCYIRESDESGCVSFSISNGFSSSAIFNYKNPGKIKGDSFGSYIVYDKNNSQYIYILSVNQNQFKEIKFDNKFKRITDDEKEIKYIISEKCEYVRAFSYLYFNSDYHIIADCKNGNDFKLIKIKIKTKMNLRAIGDNAGSGAANQNNGQTQNDQNQNNGQTQNDQNQNNGQTQNDQNQGVGQVGNQSGNQPERGGRGFERTTMDFDQSHVFNNMDDIFKGFDRDNSHFVEGDGYSLLIKPTNEALDQNVTQVNFTNCEKILREKNNLSDSYNLTILQINTKPTDSRVLTDTVQYKVYDEDNNEMDLSVCNDIKIKINYVLNDNDVLDMKKLSKFKDMNIDIINLQDDFFNDICYSYSNSSNDMILSDRVKDIYQNVSVCDNGCTYESFNLNASSVSCSCDVQEEVEEDTESRSFSSSIASAFLDSNFGVVKCYNLVFSPKNKVKNIGFWIMTTLLVAQVPFLILYMKKGLLPVLDFVQETMYRHGYLTKKNQLFEFIKNGNKEKNKCTNECQNKDLNENNLKSNDIEQVDILIGEQINNTKKTRKKGKGKKKKIKKKSVKLNFEAEIGNPPKHKTNIESEKNRENDLLNSGKNASNKLQKNNKSVINEVEIYNNGNNEQNKKIENEKEYEIEIRKKNENNSKKKKKETNDLISFDSKEKVLGIDKAKDAVKIKVKKKNSFYVHTTSENRLNNECDKKLDKESVLESKGIVSERKSEQNLKTKYISRINEEENIQKKPGFYSLIKLNLNEKIEKVPMESKYVLNNYTYEEAILYEKRSFLRLYYIYLLSKEDILNTFFFKIPFQLEQLRICMFIFNYSVDIALNAFFYLSDNISDRYHYTGANKVVFTLINNLTITLISTIVTIVLISFLDSLIQSNDKLQSVFEDEEESLKNKQGYEVSEERKQTIEISVKKIIKCLKLKIAVFFIVEYIIMLFFWYYVTAFCHVYHNTQTSWLMDCIVSFLCSILYNGIFALAFTIIYFISVKFKQKWMYKIAIFFY